MFTIELELTKSCNLQCSYCFEKKESENIISSKEAIDRINYFLIRANNAGIRDVYIDFTGGEPLLAFETIKDVVTKLQFKEYSDFDFQFGVVTNGTIFDVEKKSFLEKFKFDLTVSLDGNRQGHDINRIMKNGKGSYASIINNVPLFKDYEKTVAINMVITNNNVIYFFDNITSILELGFKIIRTKLDINSMWSKEEIELLRMQLYKGADYYFELNKNGMTVYWDFIEDGLENIQNIPSSHFCGAGIVSCCISAEGIIRCCGMCENNGIIGNIKDEISEEAFEKFAKYFKEIPKQCHECSIFDYCPQHDCIFINEAILENKEKFSKYCEWYHMQYDICNYVVDKMKEYRRDVR